MSEFKGWVVSARGGEAFPVPPDSEFIKTTFDREFLRIIRIV